MSPRSRLRVGAGCPAASRSQLLSYPQALQIDDQQPAAVVPRHHVFPVAACRVAAGALQVHVEQRRANAAVEDAQSRALLAEATGQQDPVEGGADHVVGVEIGERVLADGHVQVAPGERVLGLRLDQHANRWWQWAYSMPASESPIRDRTGAKCSVNQSGDVWFLAGGFGSSRITRHFDVPEGRHLFFPIINLVSVPAPAQLATGSVTCERALAAVTANNDHAEYVEVVVNGKRIADPEALRVEPRECFDAAGGVDGGGDRPKVYPSATDGYWVMLKPLPPGEHKISFRAKYNDPRRAFGTMIQDIQYFIRVTRRRI